MTRLPQLDGVRGIAILLVLINHYFTDQVSQELGPLINLARRALVYSWSGVDLFFALSGFLICGILLDNRESSNYFRVFYVRRVCRIFPLYYLMLALFVVCSAALPGMHWLFDAPMPLWTYFTFTQNIAMGRYGDFGANWLTPTWSLAVEEQFYLIIPVLVYLLSRRALAAVFVTGILLQPILQGASPGFHAYVLAPWRAGPLLSGALLAILVRWPTFVEMVKRNAVVLRAAMIVLVVSAGAMALQPLWFSSLKYSWLAMFYTVFVLVAYLKLEPSMEMILNSRILVWFGQLSYGIYMFHQPISGLLHGWIREAPPEIYSWSDAAVTLLALVVSLCAAALSFYLLEQPILRLGHQFKYHWREQTPQLEISYVSDA